MMKKQEASRWTRQPQVEIGTFREQLVHDMEEKVLEKYRVKEEARCTYRGRGKPLRRIYQKVRQDEGQAQGLEGRDFWLDFQRSIAMCVRVVSRKAITQSRHQTQQAHADACE